HSLGKHFRHLLDSAAPKKVVCVRARNAIHFLFPPSGIWKRLLWPPAAWHSIDTDVIRRCCFCICGPRPLCQTITVLAFCLSLRRNSFVSWCRPACTRLEVIWI